MKEPEINAMQRQNCLSVRPTWPARSLQSREIHIRMYSRLLEWSASWTLQAEDTASLFGAGELSVGVTADVSHTAATTRDIKVMATASYLKREAKLFLIEVAAYDCGR